MIIVVDFHNMHITLCISLKCINIVLLCLLVLPAARHPTFSAYTKLCSLKTSPHDEIFVNFSQMRFKIGVYAEYGFMVSTLNTLSKLYDGPPQGGEI